MPAIIRPITIDDLPDILQIEQAIFPFPWSKKMFQDSLQNPSCVHAVLELTEPNKKIIGYLLALAVLDEARLLDIGIDSHDQRQGWGQYFLEQLFQYLEKRQIKHISLEVRRSNFAAIALYERFGFVCIGERKRYYRKRIGREDALIYEKTLEFV